MHCPFFYCGSTLALRAEFVLSAEIDPPKATVAELAKASYAEEKKLEDLPTAFIDTSPNAEDGLVVGTLGIDGGEVDPILNFANEIAAGTHGEVDSLLIMYRGKLLFESYFRRGRSELPSLPDVNYQVLHRPGHRPSNSVWLPDNG